MAHRVWRIQKGIYQVHLSGRMSKQAMLQYRHDLHNVAAQQGEQVAGVIFTYGIFKGFEGDKGEQENIREFLEEYPAEYRFSIHCGVGTIGRLALMFYHRIYNRSLPPDYYADSLSEAIKLALSLRDQIEA